MAQKTKVGNKIHQNGKTSMYLRVEAESQFSKAILNIMREINVITKTNCEIIAFQFTASFLDFS